ncbi:MAG: carboxypeptidase-like regulatory domain-containing protein [Acidobacteriota bacterium]
MKKVYRSMIIALALAASLAWTAAAQSTAGAISGTVSDPQGAVITGASVTARNVGTNESRTATTDSEGRYRFPNLSIGNYEVTVQANGFAKYVRTGVELLLNQDAVINAPLKTTTVEEVVTINENASLLNTSNAEVSTRFDSKRLSELPIATNRNVFNVALSAAGVSQLASGQSGFANGVSYSANGGRLRSNNFMVDGQDINDPSVSGGQQPLNNPDIVQEVRLITNQFAAEYGRNSGSVFSVVTKAGANQYHGSAFWFNNNNHFNACSNQDKAGRPGGYCNPNATREVQKGAPFRLENQIGGTFGGPLYLPRFGEGGSPVMGGKDKTWFFGSLQRWTDRQLGSGFTLNGAPTEAGRQILQSTVGSRPQVAALLRFLPAAQTALFNANGTPRTASYTANGQTSTIPLGSFTGSTSLVYNDWQWSGRIDHQFSEKNRLNGRYLYDGNLNSGSGQATPPGLTTVVPTRSQAAVINLNSLLSSRVVNDARIAWSRYGSRSTASDPSSETIPSIELAELGLNEFNASASRTAIGLAVNLPQFRFNNTYQIQDTVAVSTGSHAVKFGFDIRRTEVKSFFIPTIRGRLAYDTLQNFVNDDAKLAATVNRPLPGGSEIQYYDNYDYYFFGQDEWKVTPNFTLSYGLRYELPGNTFNDLVPINDKIVAVAGGNAAYRFTPVPKTDKNNFQPRIGFSWSPSGKDGLLGRVTGGGRFVLRGGYARTNDAAFLNINLNIASAFPFIGSINLPSSLNAFANISTAQIAGLNPNTLARTIVSEDFRAPEYDQFSLEVQRELTRDFVLRVGYVGTKGSHLLQTLDGNPFIAGPAVSLTPGVTVCAPTATNTCRVDSTRGVIRLRSNAASSNYHSLQASLEKRLTHNFSAGLHYTYSAFIDTASEIFNPSTGSVAVAQDSFNLRNDRGRSVYDRPQRVAGNIVYQLPFFQDQKGFLGRALGGFQLNGFFTLQSGAPFTPLNGSDPARVLSGIDGLVGNAVRPNIYTNIDLSRMKVEDLFFLDQGLRNQAIQQAQAFLTANPNTPNGALSIALPNALLAVPVATVSTNAAGVKSVAVSFVGLPANGSQRVGNAGRNILRADGIQNLDFGILKNTRIAEGHTLQFRADMFNVTNTRNFGIPNATVSAAGANFLNQWATNGGNRRIVLGLRYTF